MQFEGEVAFEEDTETLWNQISDPEVLVKCVPGAQEVERVSETHYKGVVERGIGGITVQLGGEVKMEELNPPEKVVATGTGKDERTNSRMDAESEMSISETEDSSVLSYQIDIEFTGRLASLGSRLLKRKIDSDIDIFFDNLQAYTEENPTTVDGGEGVRDHS